MQKRYFALPTIGGLSLLASNAYAAVPASVTTALGDLSDDAVAVATLVLLAVVAVYAFKFIRKGL